MFTALYQIAKNTFRESLREPIYLLVLLSSLCLIGLFPVFSMFVFRAQEKLVIDSAMATTMIFGWVIAVLIASYAISREIDNGTVLLLLSKPVRRPVFVVAKILGILGASTVFWFLSAAATLISLRIAADQFRIDMRVMGLYFGAIALSFILAAIHNYVTRSSFPMTTVLVLLVLIPLVAVSAHFLKYQSFGEEHPGLAFNIIPALILILYSVWAMASLATALSTRFNLVSNLMICSVIFMVGLMSDYLLGRHTLEPWSDTVPAGKATLWVSNYRFAPTEMGAVGKWERPAKIDQGEAFVVWSDRDKPVDLPVMGTQPDKVWKDQGGWKDNASDLDSPARHLAIYDSDTQTWEVRRILEEASVVPPQAEGLEAAYTSYVFRRSLHPPRVPTGGTYISPYPAGGNLLASTLYAFVPNWQLFWLADALSAQKIIPIAYVLWGGVYVVIMNAFFMLLAVVLFWDREVGKQVIV